MQQPQPQRWTSVSAYVDEETGEELKYQTVVEYYIIVKSEKIIKHDGNVHTIYHIYRCIKSGQGKLF